MSMSNLSLLNPWIGAIAIIAVVLISVIIQLISNRWFADEDFDNIHNVGGIYMSAVATLYSVILGMILVNSSQSFIEAKRIYKMSQKHYWRFYIILGPCQMSTNQESYHP